MNGLIYALLNTVSIQVLFVRLQCLYRAFILPYSTCLNTHCLTILFDQPIEVRRINLSIAYRLSRDYCVNGFMCHDDPTSYGFDVHIRPEFIVDLVNMFPHLSELDLEWRRQSTSYKVHFFTYLHQLEGFNFELDNYRDPPYEVWNDLETNDKVIKWMLGRAIARSFDELTEIYLYVKADSFVPPEQISDCERI